MNMLYITIIVVAIVAAACICFCKYYSTFYNSELFDHESSGNKLDDDHIFVMSILNRYKEYDNADKDNKYLYKPTDIEVRNAFDVIEQMTYNESNEGERY